MKTPPAADPKRKGFHKPVRAPRSHKAIKTAYPVYDNSPAGDFNRYFTP